MAVGIYICLIGGVLDNTHLYILMINIGICKLKHKHIICVFAAEFVKLN